MAGAPGGGIVGRSVNFLIQFITTGHAQAVQQITTFAQVSQQAQQQMGRMGQQTRTLTFEVVRWAIAWQVVYRTLNLVGAGFRDAIAAGIELDTAMRNVNAIAKLSEGQLALLRKEVIALSTDTSAGLRPLKELSEALYSINSAGIIGAQAMDVLRAASQAAAAGLTDTETAATAIVSVLNAYNLNAREAGRVTDVLFKTVEVGVPRFGDLAKNIGVAAGTGRMLGVSVEELGQAWATVSRVETNAARAQVALNQVMLAFLKPSDAMIEAYDRLGVATGRDLIAKRGLIQAVLDVNEAMGGSIELVFDERRALTGANAIITAHAAALQQWGERGREAGTAAKALAEIQKSSLTPLQQYRREWERLRLEWTEGVLPTIAKVVGGMASVMQMVRESGDPTDIAGKALARRGLAGPAGPLLSLVAPGVFERWMAEERLRQLGRFPGQVGGSIAGIGLRTGELPLPPAPPTRRPVGPAPLSLDQLLRMFEMRQARGEFTQAGEVRGIGGILIPQAEKELATAQRRLELVGKYLAFQREQLQVLTQSQAKTELIQEAEEATAKASDEFKEALDRVKGLEDQLVSLEGKRLSLAKELANQYRQAGEALADAIGAMQKAEMATAEASVRGIQMALQASLEPLERFRDLMGEAMDPGKAKRLREEIQQLSLRQINIEIGMLQQALKGIQDPGLRVQTGQRLQDLLMRRAGMQAGFLVENVQAGQREFDAQQKANEERRARLQRMVQEDPFGARGAFARAQLQAFQFPQARPEVKKEDLVSIYQKNAAEIADIQAMVIDPALKKSEELARGMARAALDETLKLRGQIVQAWGAIGVDARRAFDEGFRTGTVPGAQPRGFQQTLVPQTGVTGGAGGTTINLNGVDLTGKVSESAKQELVAAVMGVAGDVAVQTERRRGTATQVA